MISKPTQYTNQEGFAVLYAVLVAGVVAVGGLLLSNIIFKQLILTNVGQNSQIAYYAADVGRYCAKYWQTRFYFGEVLDLDGDGVKELDFESRPDDVPYCHDAEASVENLQESGDMVTGASWSFTIPDIDGRACAKVQVTNNLDYYEAVSLGYNNATCNTRDQRLVLRRVRDYANN